MSTPAHNDTEIKLGLAIVSITAPAEEPYYTEVIQALPNRSVKSRDRFLASGLQSSDLWAMSVSAYILSKPILEFLWAQMKGPTETLISKTAEAAQKRLSEWIDRKMAGPAPVTLNEEAAKKFAGDLVARAPELGVSPENAKIICDALLQRLGVK